MENALKAISRTDDELRVGNYIVLFGGRDLEGIASDNKNADGTLGEFFTKATALESRYTATGRVPIDWEHDRKPELRDDGTAFDPGVLGYVDWKTAKPDDLGVWVERVLDRRNAYMSYLETLIDAGLIGTSSEAELGKTAKADNGHITRWPLASDTFSVAPMEPRMMTANALQAAKALGLVAEQPTPEGKPEAVASGGESVKAATEGNESTIEEDEMDGITEERFAELMGEFKEDILTTSKAQSDATLEAWKSAQPAKPAGVVVQDALDNKASDPELPAYNSLGEQLQDIHKAGQGGRKPSPRLLKAHKAVSGHSEGVPADGGFALQETFMGFMQKPDMMLGQILPLVRRGSLGPGSDSLSWVAIDETSRADGSRGGAVVAYYLSEADQITPSKIKLRRERLELYTTAALAYATDQLLQDAAALSSIIGGEMRKNITFKVEDKILNGTGAGMPLGALTAFNSARVSVAKETGQLADTVVSQNVIKMWNRRWRGGSYVWLIGEDVMPELQVMDLGVGTGGQLTLMPPGGLSGLPYGTLQGAPILETEYNPALGDVGDIALIDLGEYLFIDKAGIQEASSIHIRFDYAETAFRFMYRNNGQPTWHSDVTPFKATGSTKSPYIVLAERA